MHEHSSSLHTQVHTLLSALCVCDCKGKGLPTQGLWVALMTLTTLLLLLPHSGFTHVWHIASEQFNGADDYSPVWEAYRVSNAPSCVHLHG